jgi:hypothetical protein
MNETLQAAQKSRCNLKGQCHEIFDPRFFHHSTPSKVELTRLLVAIILYYASELSIHESFHEALFQWIFIQKTCMPMHNQASLILFLSCNEILKYSTQYNTGN